MKWLQQQKSNKKQDHVYTSAYTENIWKGILQNNMVQMPYRWHN